MRLKRLNGMRSLVLVIGLTVLWDAIAPAQVSWSGIYTFEIKQGGKDSRLDANKVYNKYLQINLHDLQLFLDAQVADDIFLSAKLATSPRNTSNLKGVNLELAYVTFSDLFGTGASISAGKIITPFGTYAKRQLSPDNPLIGTPLFFYYSENVSPSSGYLDSTGVLLAQSLYGGRLSTIYYGGYFTGIELFGNLAGDLLFYDFAVMNAPLSSPASETNLNKQLTLQERVAVHPAIWGTAGISYSTGSFLDRGNVNYFLDNTGSVEDYKQNTLGFDLNLNYLYYELNAEYIMNTFHSPYAVYDYTLNPPYKSGLTGRTSLDLKSSELLVDVKFDAPFYPGLYLAGRYNMVSFGSIVDPFTASSTFGRSVPWDHDVTRFEVALGFKPARGVLTKLGYQWTKVNVNPRPDLDVFGFQVSVSF